MTIHEPPQGEAVVLTKNPLARLAENAPGDTSANTGTVRVGINMMILTIIVSLIARFTSWEVNLEDLAPFAPVVAVVVAVGYRTSRVLSAKFPAFGWALFGIGSPPKYPDAIDTTATLK